MSSLFFRFFQYAAYLQPETSLPRIGHYDLDKDTITPLSFVSGTPVTDLYQVIEAGPSNIAFTDALPIPASEVKLLAPISGRDVLAVGKNYMEHAKEFNDSGFDSSDKVALPSHPVIFTKRSTSIIAHGEEIFPHPAFSSTVDYEGELGVIVGKAGFRINEAQAWDHVWGFTIINDVTARERQRDHKQFFIGKSADTFCPMGPIAVSKENVPSVLNVETIVNGEVRQSATTEDLIFSIPTLIKTISEGQTIRPGDVIATGTPAGVGIGKTPPVFLRPGDEVSITITGLGKLTNRISPGDSINYAAKEISHQSSLPISNASKTLGSGLGLTQLSTKKLNYKRLGSGSNHIVFVHGLGATMDYWTPLISQAGLGKGHSLHLFDLEGHGLSLTHALSRVSVSSIAADINAVFRHAFITTQSPAVIVAHSIGCLAALHFALNNPGSVRKLILLGPPSILHSEAANHSISARATLARTKGMSAVVDAVVDTELSDHSKNTNPLSVAAVRLSLLGQDPESYAKACMVLADSIDKVDIEKLPVPTTIITGQEDLISPPSLCKEYSAQIKDCNLVVLDRVGHWHAFEDLVGAANSVRDAL